MSQARRAALLLSVALAALTGCPAPSTTDAGSDGGAPPDAGVPDSGAPDAGFQYLDAGLIVDSVYTYRTGNTWVDGVVWGGPRGVTVMVSGGNSYPAIAWLDVSGVWVTQGLPTAPDPIGPAVAAALAPNDFFRAAQTGPAHYVDDQLLETGAACPSPLTWTSAAVSPTGEAWFAGISTGAQTDGGLCHWSPDAGFADFTLAPAGHQWSALVALADGGLLLGDEAGSVTQLDTGAVTQVFPFGVTALFRAADDVWATGGADAGLAWLQPGGTWHALSTGASVQDLRSVWAASPSDLWVAGPSTGVWRFDGSGWQQLPALPGVPFDFRPTFVSGSQQQLFFGGYTDGTGLGDTHACAVVLHRR